jgi:hypothetical protein
MKLYFIHIYKEYTFLSYFFGISLWVGTWKCMLHMIKLSFLKPGQEDHSSQIFRMLHQSMCICIQCILRWDDAFIVFSLWISFIFPTKEQILRAFLSFFLFIYSYVHTLFGPFLPATPHPSLFPLPPTLPGTTCAAFSLILLKSTHKQ